MAVNPADELAQSFGPQQDFGPQDSGPAVTTNQNISTDTSGSRFEPEIGRLREIQTQLPGAIQKAAAAEGEALKSKLEAETAGAEKLDKAAQARTDATRGAYDAYGEKITKQPLPAFVPTEENAETLGALFSGVNLLGLIMSRGAGRSSALGAMKSMTGMLEGYKSGRKDLYEREKQVFEKNYARIKDIHAQYAKDLDKAVKLAEVDFEGGKIAAQLAAKKAGNSYAEKAASAGNLKAVVTSFNEEAKLIKQITDLQDREMNRESREAIAALRANAPGRQGQNALTFAARVFNSLQGGAQDLINISQLKTRLKTEGGKKEGATGSILAGLISSEPATVRNSLIALAGRKITKDDQRLFDMLTGQVGAALSRIESQGLASGSTKANIDSFNALKPKAGDAAITLPFYLTRVKQEIQTGYKSFRRMPGATSEQIADIEQVLKSLDAAIPFDLTDVYAAMAGQPLVDKASNIINLGSFNLGSQTSPQPAPGQTPAPAGSGTQDIEKLARARFGSYEPDKYDYGTNPDTGQFARRKKQ